MISSSLNQAIEALRAVQERSYPSSDSFSKKDPEDKTQNLSNQTFSHFSQMEASRKYPTPQMTPFKKNRHHVSHHNPVYQVGTHVDKLFHTFFLKKDPSKEGIKKRAPYISTMPLLMKHASLTYLERKTDHFKKIFFSPLSTGKTLSQKEKQGVFLLLTGAYPLSSFFYKLAISHLYAQKRFHLMREPYEDTFSKVIKVAKSVFFLCHILLSKCSNVLVILGVQMHRGFHFLFFPEYEMEPFKSSQEFLEWKVKSEEEFDKNLRKRQEIYKRVRKEGRLRALNLRILELEMLIRELEMDQLTLDQRFLNLKIYLNRYEKYLKEMTYSEQEKIHPYWRCHLNVMQEISTAPQGQDYNYALQRFELRQEIMKIQDDLLELEKNGV